MDDLTAKSSDIDPARANPGRVTKTSSLPYFPFIPLPETNTSLVKIGLFGSKKTGEVFQRSLLQSGPRAGYN